MDMTGEYRIPAARQTVWDALNDTDVLLECIPGCQSIERVSDTELAARVKAKVGPVSATFNGTVTLQNLSPPEAYTIAGEGKGGAAGFAKGGADVRLAEDGPETTVLTYEVHATFGGKLAQLGARVIKPTTKKMADEFFGRLVARLQPGAAAVDVETGAPVIPASETEGPVMPTRKPSDPSAPPEPGSTPAATPASPAAKEPPGTIPTPEAKEPPGTIPTPEPGAAEAPPSPPSGERPAEPPPAVPDEAPSPAEAGRSAAYGQADVAQKQDGVSGVVGRQDEPPPKAGLSPVIWIGGIIAALLLLVLLFSVF